MATQGKSYNQVMSEWAAQRTFVGRLRSRIWHPPYDSPWYGKLYGYLWRLAAALFMLGFIYYNILRLRFKTAAFRKDFAVQAASYMNGKDAYCGKFKLPLFSGMATINSLGMSGTEKSFFNKVDAYNLNLDLGLGLFKRQWQLDHIYIDRAVVELRSGGLGSTAPGSSTKPADSDSKSPRAVLPDFKTGMIPGSFPELGDGLVAGRDSSGESLLGAPRLMTGGFSLTPNLSTLDVKRWTIRDLTATWGFSPSTRGKLESTNAIIERTAAGDWELSMTEGKISQNWLDGMQLEMLQGRVTATEIVIDRLAASHGQDVPRGLGLTPKRRAHVAMSGKVTLGELPQLDLDVIVEGMSLKGLAPRGFAKYFSTVARGKGKITGTVNKQTGIQTDIEFEMLESDMLEEDDKKSVKVRGHLTSLPVMRALYVAASEERFVQLPLEHGTWRMTTGVMNPSGTERSTILSNMDLRAVDKLVRIVGKMKFTEELDSTNGTGFRVDAELKIGLAIDKVKAMPANIQERFFTMEAEGMRWMDCVLNNDPGTNMTQQLADEISRLKREADDAASK